MHRHIKEKRKGTGGKSLPDTGMGGGLEVVMAEDRQERS